MEGFRFEVLPEAPAPGAVEIVLAGTLGTVALGPLQQEMALLLAKGTTVMILRMEKVEHISSAAYAELVAVADKLERTGGRVVLCAIPSKLRTVMTALGLEGVFLIAGDAAQARAAASRHAEHLQTAPRLVALFEGGPKRPVPILDVPILLGSDGRCAIVLRHPHVEPRHTEVTKRADHVYVRDLGSRYGTWIDHRRILDAVLDPGHVLRVADFQFRLDPGAA